MLAVLALAACEPPSPALELQLSPGPAQMCPSTNCAEIEMTCEMFMSIRILDPSDPQAPFYSDCIAVPQTNADQFCSIGGIQLRPMALPYRDLEVQIAIFREAQGVTFLDPERKFPVCPPPPQYDSVDGFPIASTITPALGGRSFYRAGDDVISVTLGCSNIEELTDATCSGGIGQTRVQATVDDFDSHVSVGATAAERLTVAVGEPKPSDLDFILTPTDVTTLTKSQPNPPAWAMDVPRLFTSSACLTTLDDTPQSTTAVTCRDGISITTKAFSITGVRLTKASLDQILAALSLAQFPIEGITIGVVVDGGTPVAGQVVSATSGTIEYLNASRTAVGGTSTSGGVMGGVFVSRDAPYGTTFSTTRATPIPPTTVNAYGGRIAGKVNIVVLDLSRVTSPQ